MRYNLLFHILLFSLTSYTQNLVKNPSFEEYNICPSNGVTFDNSIKDWKVATIGPNYFHRCSNSIHHGVPQNIFGIKYPHAGDAYISVLVFTPHYNPGVRGYVQVGLQSTLLKNKLYCVSYYTSPSPKNNSFIKNIDLYFSDTLLPKDNNVVQNVLDNFNPQIKSPSLLEDSVGWDRVEGIYKAKGGENFIVIGNFNNYQNTTVSREENFQNPIGYLYYYIDNVSVVPLNLNKPDLGSDTLLCNSDFPHVLRAPKGYDSYLWNDSSTADTIVVYSEGNYKVNCVLDGCGELTDSIRIDLYESNNLVTFDTTFCKGDSLVLSNPHSFDTYDWSTNSTNTSIVVKSANTYTLTVTDQCRTQIDSFKVTMDSIEVVQMNIQTDTNICNEESMTNDLIQLYSLSKQSNYQWSNGSTQDTTFINSTGNYWFETEFKCGISKSNSIRVEGCPLEETKIFIPNAFSPNGDGINDLFQPEGENFKLTQMLIYNRWGEQVYRSNTPYWDGRIKGKKAQTGVYFYLISFKDAIGEQKQLKGTVSVIY